jgi:hypothetical protein
VHFLCNFYVLSTYFIRNCVLLISHDANDNKRTSLEQPDEPKDALRVANLRFQNLQVPALQQSIFNQS